MFGCGFVQMYGMTETTGTIVALPIFLQKLMGYNAYLAGLAIAPGGTYISGTRGMAFSQTFTPSGGASGSISGST